MGVWRETPKDAVAGEVYLQPPVHGHPEAGQVMLPILARVHNPDVTPQGLVPVDERGTHPSFPIFPVNIFKEDCGIRTHEK